MSKKGLKKMQKEAEKQAKKVEKQSAVRNRKLSCYFLWEVGAYIWI